MKCKPELALKPTFSPNSEILVVSPRGPKDRTYAYDRLDRRTKLRVVLLPPTGEAGPVIVSEHVLDFDEDYDEFGGLHSSREDFEGVEQITSVSFVDNETFYCIRNSHQFYKCKIKRGRNNQVILTKPKRVLSSKPKPSDTLIAASATARGIIAYLTENNSKIFFVDLEKRVYVERSTTNVLGEVRDIVFSPDGRKLILCHGNGYGFRSSGCGFSIYDCNFNLIQTIHDEAKVVRLYGEDKKDGEKGYTCISFTPNPNRIAVRYTPTSWYDTDDDHDRIRIIDLEKNVVVSDGWKEDTWGKLVS